MESPADLRAEIVSTLLHRRVESGAFRARADDASGVATAEASAWAVTALRVARHDAADWRPASDFLAGLQLADGRISSHPMHPGTYFPTAITIYAWAEDGHRIAERDHAIAFLVSHSGTTFPRDLSSPLEMNTEIPGWPWVDRTFSWVDPTAMALLALIVAGHPRHPRALDGERMLLDRQIASGGWNYGNARVFGAELRPAPESTGLALAALAGRVSEVSVATSLTRLDSDLAQIRTPLSYSWSLLAASAWSRRPSAGSVIAAARDILDRADRYGGYETAELALLLVALSAERGLVIALNALRAVANVVERGR